MADNAARPSQQPPRSQPPSTEDIDDDWATGDAPVPAVAANPSEPVRPAVAANPSEPVRPAVAANPSEPVRPAVAANPSEPVRPAVAAIPAAPKLPREASAEPAELAPPPLESAVAQTIPVREAPAELRRGLSVPTLAGMALAAALAVWLAFGRGAGEPPQPQPVVSAPKRAARVVAAAPGLPTAASSASQVPAQPATAQPSPASQELVASPAPPAAPAAGEVLIRLTPEDAKLYRKGKRVGGSGTVLRLQAGERLAFEVVKRGYATRKLVVDGSEPKVHVVLKAESAGAP